LVFLKLSLNQIDAFTRTKAYSLKKKSQTACQHFYSQEFKPFRILFSLFSNNLWTVTPLFTQKKVDHIQIIFV